jgi:cation transport regulator ChaB
MPTTKEDLPSTIARSPEKVQRTYSEALDSAHEQYEGDEERAHRTAYAGRSRMTKDELARALQRHSNRETARARR